MMTQLIGQRRAMRAGVLTFFLAAAGCAVSQPAEQAQQAQPAQDLAGKGQVQQEQIQIAALGAKADAGIFDPSFALDENGRLWMSYSAVQASPKFGKAFNAASTRVARSDDGGETWTDVGVVNAAKKQPLPPPNAKLNAQWMHEVSRILYDPYAPASERWKLLWHRYLRVYDGKSADSVPLFEHGWMELRSAASPTGPWSGGRKLFAGRGYDKTNDNTIGPPEIRLDQLAPGKDRLGRCVAFTEPGMIARPEGVYVTLKCATGKPTGQVALLRCDHGFGSCTYLGRLLRDAEAARFGSGFSGFSGTDLVESNGKPYLVATPTRQPGETYHGCLFFAVTSLEDARVNPEPVLRVDGAPGSFNGACGYAGGDSGPGVFYSQFAPTASAPFRVYKAGKRLD